MGVLLYNDHINVFKTEEHEKMMYITLVGIMLFVQSSLNMKQLSYVARVVMIPTFTVLFYMLFYTLISFYFYELEQEKMESLLKKPIVRSSNMTHTIEL